MKTATILVMMFGATATAYADLSYTMAMKHQGSAPTAGPSATRFLFKGQKMLTDRSTGATILDFDAQTITTLNKAQKTYSVMKFSDVRPGPKQSDIDTRIAVKDTGQTKVINGFKATETVLTMEVDNPQFRQAGMKMQMEIDIWRSSDVPGARELKAFYQRNGAHFPWAAMGSSAAQGVQEAMAELQRKMTEAGGVILLQTVRTKAAGGDQAEKMQKARAQLEATIQQGGRGADAARQALARMSAAGASGGSPFEVTMESGDFSTRTIPDSAFAIPAGFQKVERK